MGSNKETIVDTIRNQQLPFRNYQPARYSNIFPEFDKRLNSFQQFYFQQTERMSAFQYVRDHAIEGYMKRYVLLNTKFFWNLNFCKKKSFLRNTQVPQLPLCAAK